MKSSRLYTPVILFCTAVSAWPSFLEPAELIERGRQLIEVRQQTSKSFDLSITADQGQITSTSATATTGSKTTGNSATTTQSDSGTTGSATSNNTSAADTSVTQTTFGPSAGIGSIQMQTPDPFSGAQFYKIQDYVTLGWNYTNCLRLPTAVDILAVASASNIVQTYTLAMNQSVSGTSQAFTWNSSNYQATATNNQLLTASYTLVVYDADFEVSSTPRPGYLGTFRSFGFGMYSPQPSSTFGGITCITCSAAMSSVEKQAYSVVFGMMAVTVLSFTWFAGAAGIF